MNNTIKLKIKKGDTVKIIAGKDKGKTGKVLNVFLSRQRVMVEGVNISKKHVRPKRSGEKGQVVEVARPIALSNIQVVCASCSRTTRIGFKKSDVQKEKIRYCKKCKAQL